MPVRISKDSMDDDNEYGTGRPRNVVPKERIYRQSCWLTVKAEKRNDSEG